MQSSTEISAQPSPDRSQIERLTPASTRLPQAAAPGTGAGVTQPDQINGEDAGKGAMRPVNCDECIVRQISAVGRASERAPQLKTVFEIHCRPPRAICTMSSASPARVARCPRGAWNGIRSVNGVQAIAKHASAPKSVKPSSKWRVTIKGCNFNVTVHAPNAPCTPINASSTNGQAGEMRG